MRDVVYKKLAEAHIFYIKICNFNSQKRQCAALPFYVIDSIKR